MMIQRDAAPNDTVFEHLADELDADQIMNLVRAAGHKEPPATRETLRRFRNIMVGPQ